MKDLIFILKYLKKYKKDLFLTIFLVVVETAFELIIPFLMKDIIDIGIQNQNLRQILLSGSLIIGCALISLFTGHIYAIFNARLVTNFAFTLRQEVFQKVQEFSFSNLDHFQTASIVTRITNDVTILQNTLVGGIRPLFRSPMMLTMGVVLSFIMAPSLAWIFLACIPVLGTILCLILWKTAPKYTILQAHIDELNRVVRENVSAIRTVKSYVREEHEINKFQNKNKDVKEITENTFKIAQLNQPSFQLVMYAVTVLLLGLGSTLVYHGELQVGRLSALLSYTLQVVNSLMMLSNVFLLVNRSFSASKRLKEIIVEKPDIQNKEQPLLSIDNTDVSFRNVYFKYHKDSQAYVLENINLEIPAGKSIGILGGTGSGKTSLVSLILRLYEVSKGEVLLGGIPIESYELSVLRSQIAIVLQTSILFSGTIRENLLWGDETASLEDIEKVCKIACVDEFINQLPQGLEYDLGQGGVNVSGGQKQRLSIARALLKKPSIIIFDDATSACDMDTERKIMQHIREMRGMTSIIIAQRITSVMEADEIVILDEGKIIDHGTHDELLSTSAIYQELYKEQLGGVTKCHQ